MPSFWFASSWLTYWVIEAPIKWVPFSPGCSGVMGPGTTEDGFGMAFGVNHLGHFLLTNLLLDRLRQCGPSRVVTVAALLHRFGHIDFPLLASQKDLVSSQSTWYNVQSYCGSKLCNVLFTRELANQLEGTSVTCYSLHPGQCYWHTLQDFRWFNMSTAPCLVCIPFSLGTDCFVPIYVFLCWLVGRIS